MRLFVYYFYSFEQFIMIIFCLFNGRLKNVENQEKAKKHKIR